MSRKEKIKQKIRTKRGLYTRARKKKFDRLKHTGQYENYDRQKEMQKKKQKEVLTKKKSFWRKIKKKLCY